MKILVVEGEKYMQDRAGKYLATEGFLVDTVQDFTVARNRINVCEYDCLVLDLALLGGRGFDLLVELKSIRPNTGVIMT